ncbi:hypothetical protein ACTWQB_16250, partial [Piscibacillus sp. B03]
INIKKRKQEIEIFTLYDILKADLHALQPGQEINLYGLLRDRVSTFQHIQNPLSRFLSLWMTEPEKAKYVMGEAIGTNGAKTLGEVLVRLDSASKEEAISILENESEVYHESFYKKELENQLRKKTYVLIFFGVTIFIQILWLILIFTSITLLHLENDVLF